MPRVKVTFAHYDIMIKIGQNQFGSDTWKPLDVADSLEDAHDKVLRHIQNTGEHPKTKFVPRYNRR